MALKERKQAIDSCIQWVDSIGQSNCDYYSHVINLDKISFQGSSDTIKKNGSDSAASNQTTSSYRPLMVGVFAKETIKQGEILMTVSQDCVVHESHPLLVDLAKDVVDKAMAVYRDNTTAQYAQDRYNYSPWDPYTKQKQKGRVFCEDELRLALHMTLLLFSHQLQKEQSPNQVISSASASALTRAARHWKHYFDTLPENYDSLIFHWTEDEIDNLRGTACHSLVQRLRREMDDNWEQSFRDVLEDYLLATVESTEDVVEIDRHLLQKCYRRAICTIYSRMHALEVVAGETTAQKNSRCTCPLIDLINGDREDSPRVNTHLLHFPGTHVALQAGRDIAAGEEIMFSYGQVANQIFVSKFGFLPLGNESSDSKGMQFPCMGPLDVVHLLPPQHLVWEESDPRWNELTSDRSGKALERRHLIEKPPYVTAQVGTPFALMGDKLSMGKVRSSETEWRPHYLNNIHLYAVLSLTTKEALDKATASGKNIVIEPWEPGSIILEMIDYRLQQFPTSSLQEDESLLKLQHGNTKTGTLYRMLEREILQMWRHAIAMHYDCYGEPDSKGVAYEPLDKDKAKSMCATCNAALAGPLKCCTQCMAVFYCSRACQKEDWKAGHKEACKKGKA